MLVKGTTKEKEKMMCKNPRCTRQMKTKSGYCTLCNEKLEKKKEEYYEEIKPKKKKVVSRTK